MNKTLKKPLRKTGFISASIIGLFIASGAAFAHDDAYLDTINAPNGGQLRMAGNYHFELVVVKDSKTAKNNPIMVYVTDHAGTKIPTAGTSGTATILSGTSKATATLVPDGDNRLKGHAAYASTPNLKAILSITPAGKSTEQARFTPLSLVKEAPSTHKDHKH